MFVNLRPPLELVSSSAIDQIHEASLRILEEIGYVFTCQEAIDVLETLPGIKVDRDSQHVWFDRKLVESMVAKCPSSFSIHGRNPSRTVSIGGNAVVFAPTYGCPFTADRERGRRRGTLDDLAELVKLVHMIPSLDMSGSAMIEPQELDVELRPLYTTYYGLKYSDKPSSGSSFGKLGVDDSMTLATIIFDGQDLVERPVLIGLVNSISPLLFDERMSEVIMGYAAAGQPLIIAPAVMGGITGAMTLAGSMAQQNAEVLAGIVLAQAVRPGTPMIYGDVTTVGDMKVGAPAYGSAESAICISVGAQLARRYGLPSRGGGVLTDSKLPDVQAGIERMLLMMTTVLCGENYVLHAGGMLESFLVSSYELFCIDDDVIGMVKRFVEGMKVDDEEIALDVIREVGPQGMFLTTEHTYTHFKGSYFEPTLADRQIYAEWAKRGSKSAEERATERWKKLLADYEEPALDPAAEREIVALIKSREQSLVR